MSLCQCAHRPSCESNRCCEDDTSTIALKDARTGVPRAPADFSLMLLWSREPYPRVVFYCGACWKALQEDWKKPIPGLDRPKGASPFWRPSILEMCRLAIMETNRQDRAKQPPVFAMPDRPILERERKLTAAQWQQTLFMRRAMRDADTSHNREGKP